MISKLYTAFVSSTYRDLHGEREEVVDSLLDNGVFPVCMEHFIVNSTAGFADITPLIDDSDIFFLLMGTEYGTIEANGKSITENEYDYANKSGKFIVVLTMPELEQNCRKSDEEQQCLTEDQRRQINFCKRILYRNPIGGDMSIRRIVNQAFTPVHLARLSGWERRVRLSASQLESWQQEHAVFDLSGLWYHAHLSDDDDKYIRIGTIRITQQFLPDEYNKLHFEGHNYNIKFDPTNDTYTENHLKRTIWSGEYTLYPDSMTVTGLFCARREFTGPFGDITQGRGTRRGIHDFVLEANNDGRTCILNGEFHDEAPSPKCGIIRAFRKKEELDKYLLDNFRETMLLNI